jgi:tyrosinase
LTPIGDPDQRNAAHSGPVFLPWHRMYLRRFERELQRVLDDDTFGLPYWNWAIDGQLPPDRQPKAPIWGADAMGPGGEPVREGAFRFDRSNPEDPENWRVRVFLTDESLIRLDSNRGLERTIGRDMPTLPKTEEVNDALALANYDTYPWSRRSRGSFRNKLEGWSRDKPLLHNRVHVWVGGDMGWGHSPNDPVFFLHHANVDRIWAYWQSRSTSGPYVPDQNAPQGLFHHRIDDPMFPMESSDHDVTPKDMSAFPRDYTYDTYEDMKGF